jgi:hypothetical protein
MKSLKYKNNIKQTKKYKVTKKYINKNIRKNNKRKTRKYKKGGSRILLKGIKDDYNIKLIKKNDSYSIYNISYENNCEQYFYVPYNKNFLLYELDKNKYILFNLNNDDDTIPDEIYDICNKVVASSSSVYLVISRLKNYENIIINTKKCHKPLYNDYTWQKVQDKMNELNNLITKKCNNLYMKIDYVYNLPGHIISYSDWTKFLDIDLVLLCLYNENQCVSSIEFDKNGDISQISSKTEKDYEGRKYNKLLRGAAIILAKELGLSKLSSYAINPVSAWLLMSYYNAIVIDNEDFDKYMVGKTLSLDILKQYIPSSGEKFSLNLDIQLDEINVNKAYEEFNKLVDIELDNTTQIICP